MCVASASPLCGCWDCVPYVSECAHISVQVYYGRTSRFQQICEPTDFCKAETISSQRTTEPTRRRQKTESGGFNKRTVHHPRTKGMSNKYRLIVLVCTNVDGSLKATVTIVRNSKNPQCCPIKKPASYCVLQEIVWGDKRTSRE